MLPSGDLILLPDAGASKVVWQLQYSALSPPDLQALTSLYQACAGPVHSFTFIDPADNMLTSSAAFATPAWNVPSTIAISSGAPDPVGGTNAFVLTNTGQASQAVTQTLAVPAWYEYCFSLYVVSKQPSSLTLIRQGAASQTANACPVGANWSRIVSAGPLSDSSSTFTVGIELSAGQQVAIYGPQLEPQGAPSRYRSTTSNGGVYRNAHWGADEFLITAQAPNLFATAFVIETAVQD